MKAQYQQEQSELEKVSQGCASWCEGVGDTFQRCCVFSVQRKASLQEAMTEDISDTRRREVEQELVMVERRIQEVIERQEHCQTKIDEREQNLQMTSRKQDEGGEECCVGCGDVFGYSVNTCGTYMVPAVSTYTSRSTCC